MSEVLESLVFVQPQANWDYRMPKNVIIDRNLQHKRMDETTAF